MMMTTVKKYAKRMVSLQAITCLALLLVQLTLAAQSRPVITCSRCGFSSNFSPELQDYYAYVNTHERLCKAFEDNILPLLTLENGFLGPFQGVRSNRIFDQYYVKLETSSSGRLPIVGRQAVDRPGRDEPVSGAAFRMGLPQGNWRFGQKVVCDSIVEPKKLSGRPTLAFRSPRMAKNRARKGQRIRYCGNKDEMDMLKKLDDYINFQGVFHDVTGKQLKAVPPQWLLEVLGYLGPFSLSRGLQWYCNSKREETGKLTREEWPLTGNVLSPLLVHGSKLITQPQHRPKESVPYLKVGFKHSSRSSLSIRYCGDPKDERDMLVKLNNYINKVTVKEDVAPKIYT